jgi:hypothetical protein
MPMTNGALIEEVDSAYRRLSASAEDLVRADRELAEYVRRFAWTTPRPSLRPRTRGQPAYTSTACSTPTNIDAWRPIEQKLISTTSTQDARSSGCT